MRIVVHGQQAFGKAVLERLLERGEDVVGVFCAPDRDGRPPDPLALLAEERGLPLHRPATFKDAEAHALMASCQSDLCMMAYVTLFVPQPVLVLPALGTFQYHPSLLPLHRGPSSINWPIIMGETRTGLSIFWPDEGLDEGPILLQKEIEIGPDDTLGTVYFGKLFPMGVDAMMEALDMVRAGTAPRIPQDHSRATYESACRKADAAVDWSKPAAAVHNLIRGCDPQPGAWTTRAGTEVQLFDSRRGTVSGSGAPGTILGVSAEGIDIATGDGSVLVRRVRPTGGGKVAASEWAAEAGVAPGESLGT